MLPICVGVAAFAQPVVRLLFEHGKFTGTDTAAVAWLVALYVGAIFGAGLGDVVSRTFYAQHDTLTPVIVSAVVFGIAAGLKIALVGSRGATALVAATSLYFVANAGVLLVVLVGRMTPAILTGVAAAAARAIAGTVVACLVAALVIRWPSVWAVVPAAAGAAVAYLLALRLMGDEFAMRITGRLSNRVQASA
jgi:putative peptidoglycan lipid II flippase